MKWKQFFTPVQSVDRAGWEKAVELVPLENQTLLDVRQPSEYNISHLPGAVLIPLPELNSRIDLLNQDKDILVY